MGLFTKKIGPVFLKDTSDADNYIEKLQALAQKATGNNAKVIEKQINLIKSGKYGESNVAYELKNSGMDMYILHDIYLEQGNQSAQIDYLVVTRKRTYVIECKMLTGDIEIDNTGAFIRKYEQSGKTIREGFYSPITQNQMHLQVIKEVWNNNKLNFFNRSKFERNFNDNFQSIIVLANPKTCINMEYAPKEIKEQVIRSDQLIAYIQKKDSISNNEMSNNDMLDAAQFYLSQHKPGRFDYAKKYEELVQNTKPQKSDNKTSYIKHESKQSVTTNTTVHTLPTLNANVKNDKEKTIEKLKEFRLNQSRTEGIKPFYIFNNAQMEDLLSKMPRTKDELLKVSGFGATKVNKYGDEILKILWEYE